MPRVYVSIGSNIEREKNIRAAVQALRTRFGSVAASRVYQTKAEGFVGDDFYNLAAAFDTLDSIETVKSALAEIEAMFGRARSPERFGPRTLDIDLLLYGDVIRHEDVFDVPRADITRSAFVLGPLAELAPLVRHPETGETFSDLWRRFQGTRELAWVPGILDV